MRTYMYPPTWECQSSRWGTHIFPRASGHGHKDKETSGERRISCITQDKMICFMHELQKVSLHARFKANSETLLVYLDRLDKILLCLLYLHNSVEAQACGKCSQIVCAGAADGLAGFSGGPCHVGSDDIFSTPSSGLAGSIGSPQTTSTAAPKAFRS